MKLKFVIFVLCSPLFFGSVHSQEPIEIPSWEMGWETDMDGTYTLEITDDNDIEDELLIYIDNQRMTEINIDLTIEWDSSDIPIEIDYPESVTVSSSSNETISIMLKNENGYVFERSPNSSMVISVTADESVFDQPTSSQEIDGDIVVPSVYDLLVSASDTGEKLYPGSDIEHNFIIENKGNSDDANLEMEVSISHGVGYILADKNKTSDSNFIPIDSIFSPIVKVNYSVSPTQVGQVTNYDKLTLDVETDGSVKPTEAISSVGKTLGELWKLFADIDEGVGLELGELTISEGSSPDLSLSVDALDLSERPRNCLGRENITTVGQILEYTEDDLLNLTNFGQKSLDELVAKLDELGLSLPTSSDLDSGENPDA